MARWMRCLVPLLLLATACSGSDDAQNGPEVLAPGDSATALIAAATGGQVRSPNGVLTLDIAPDALPEDTEITVTELGELAFELRPPGLVFDIPATATFDLPSESTEPFFAPVVFPILIDPNDGSLEPTGSLVVAPRDDAPGVVVTAEVPHFSLLRLTTLFGFDGATAAATSDPPADRWPSLNELARQESFRDRPVAVYFVGESFNLSFNLNVDTSGETSYRPSLANAHSSFRIRSGTVTTVASAGATAVEALEPTIATLGASFEAGDLFGPIMVDFGYRCRQKGNGLSLIIPQLTLEVALTITETVVRSRDNRFIVQKIADPPVVRTTLNVRAGLFQNVACVTAEDRLVDALDISQQEKDDIKRAAASVGANTCAQSCAPDQACQLTQDVCAPLPSQEECDPPAPTPELLSVMPNSAPSGAPVDIRTTGLPFFGANPSIVFEAKGNPSVQVFGVLTSADSTLENVRGTTPLDFRGNVEWDLFIDYQLCDGSTERAQTNRVAFTARTLAIPTYAYQAGSIVFTVAGEPVWPLSVSLVPPESGSVVSDFFAENEVAALGGNRWQAVLADAISCPGGIAQLPTSTPTAYELVVADQINQRAVVHFNCLE